MRTPKVFVALLKYPLVVGATLAFAGLIVGANATRLFGARASAWPPTFVLALCMTPMAVYADYVRAVPGTYCTLVGWLSIAIGWLTWTAAAWLQLEATAIAMSPHNRGWYRCMGVASFLIAIYASKAVYRRIHCRGKMEIRANSAR